MKIFLIMLADQIVLVSDQKIQEGDWCLDVIAVGLGAKPRIRKASKHFAEDVSGDAFKIIAGIPELPSIDFSDLSEEDCKKIGWVDIEKLAKEFSDQSFHKQGKNDLFDGFIEGSKISQSLNEKKFDLGDLEILFNYLSTQYGYGRLDTLEAFKHHFYKKVEELSNIKIFDAEVEMQTDWKDHTKVYMEALGDNVEDFEYSPQPNIANNSIKIKNLSRKSDLL